MVLNKKRTLTVVSIVLLVTFLPLITVNVSFASASDPSISIVKSASTDLSSITLGSDSNPINSTLKVDIRIDNAGPIWAWNINQINWNASLLKLIKAVKGSFLDNNTGGSTQFLCPSSNWDNTNGTIQGGISEGLTSDGTSLDTSGVLATLSFNVTNYGTSKITIAGAYCISDYSEKLQDPHYTGTSILCNNATVTVLAATSPTPTPSSNPDQSNNTSGNAIKVFTDRSLADSDVSSSYGPHDLLRIYAMVTHNNASVSNIQVSFTIQSSNGTVIAIREANTNQTGIAVIEYRLPDPDNSSQLIVFGSWTIIATANLLQTTITSTTQFVFNYLSNIESVLMPASIHRLDSLPITITINNGYFAQTCSQLDITIVDQANIAVGSFTYNNELQMQNFTVIELGITIPSSAFTGKATVYLSLLGSNGTALAPDTVVDFEILA